MTDKMHFCTIIYDLEYIDYIKVQYKLLKQFNNNIEISVLVSTKNINDIQTPQFQTLPDGIKCFTLVEVCKEGVAKKIFDKYHSAFPNEFRWSIKPVFLNYLFKQNTSDKIIFTDWDIAFFDDYNFLFDDLDKFDVLLTPHWKTMSPFTPNIEENEQRNFFYLFTQGLFQAGFIGAHKNSEHLLDWWANICLYTCEIDESKGLFADQTHLNLLPLISDKVGIVRHKGCNIACWNKTECRRTLVNGSTLINEEYPIIFIHFTAYTIEHILNDGDVLLKSYLDKYAAIYFEITNNKLPAIVNYEIKQIIKNEKDSFLKITTKKIIGYKNKIRITTRIRRFFEGTPY